MSFDKIAANMGEVECDRCGTEYYGYKALTRPRLCRRCYEGWNPLDDNIPLVLTGCDRWEHEKEKK